MQSCTRARSRVLFFYWAVHINHISAAVCSLHCVCCK